jgi:hypothetical protein
MLLSTALGFFLHKDINQYEPMDTIAFNKIQTAWWIQACNQWVNHSTINQIWDIEASNNG